MIFQACLSQLILYLILSALLVLLLAGIITKPKPMLDSLGESWSMPKVEGAKMEVFFAARGQMDFSWTGVFNSRISWTSLPRFSAQIKTGRLNLKSDFSFGVQVEAELSKKLKFPLGPRVDLLHMQLPVPAPLVLSIWMEPILIVNIRLKGKANLCTYFSVDTNINIDKAIAATFDLNALVGAATTLSASQLSKLLQADLGLLSGSFQPHAEYKFEFEGQGIFEFVVGARLNFALDAIGPLQFVIGASLRFKMDASEIEEVEKDDTCSDRTYGGDSGSGVDLGLSIDARLAVNVMADINAVRVFDVSGLLGIGASEDIGPDEEDSGFINIAYRPPGLIRQTNAFQKIFKSACNFLASLSGCTNTCGDINKKFGAVFSMMQWVNYIPIGLHGVGFAMRFSPSMLASKSPHAAPVSIVSEDGYIDLSSLLTTWKIEGRFCIIGALRGSTDGDFKMGPRRVSSSNLLERFKPKKRRSWILFSTACIFCLLLLYCAHSYYSRGDRIAFEDYSTLHSEDPLLL